MNSLSQCLNNYHNAQQTFEEILKYEQLWLFVSTLISIFSMIKNFHVLFPSNSPLEYIQTEPGDIFVHFFLFFVFKITDSILDGKFIIIKFIIGNKLLMMIFFFKHFCLKTLHEKYFIIWLSHIFCFCFYCMYIYVYVCIFFTLLFLPVCVAVTHTRGIFISLALTGCPALVCTTHHWVTLPSQPMEAQKRFFFMLVFLHSPVPVPFLSGLHLAAESPDWGSCGTWRSRTKWKARRESFPPSGPGNKSPRPESSRPACGVHCRPLCSRTSVM